MGGVFLRRTVRAKAEVMSNLGRDVSNLFDTLFYLGPPYFGNENDYGRGMFDRSQFERMAQVLGELRGRFILSLNDRPQVRTTFARFRVDSVGTHYGISGKGETPAREVIITG